MRIRLAALAILLLFPSLSSSLEAQEPAMTFAVFKASYKSAGSTDVVGGICGAAYFVSGQMARSAYHVINENTFKPNPGYTRAQIWLVNETFGAIEIFPSQVRYIHEADAAAIEFKTPVVPRSYVFEQSKVLPAVKAQASVLGYPVTQTGHPDLFWVGDHLILKGVQGLKQVEHQGSVESVAVGNVNASDVQIKDSYLLKMNVTSEVGMSGGPTLVAGRVVATNSFGFPADQQIKTQTFSVSLSSLP